MVRIFESPDTKKTEKIDVDTSVCMFFFGPVYLVMKGLWQHLLIWLSIVAPAAWMFDGMGLMISAFFVSAVYAAKIQSILTNK